VSTPVLVARGLVAAHPGRTADEPPACGPLDLALEPGGLLVITGGNGSGKSALLSTLAGLVPPVAGTVAIDGLDPFAPATRREARLRVGVVFQEPELQHLTATVARELAFPLENLGWARARIEARVEEALRAFGLLALRAAAPGHLSGGEVQRVALAAALAPGPRLVFFDEPVSYLDPPGREALLAEVERLRAAGTAVVWTACDPSDAPAGGGRLALGGGEADGLAPHATPAHALAPGAVLWSARGLSRYRGDGRGETRLWGGLELTIRAGERIAIAGANGTGKTAFLDLLAGVDRPRAGRGLRGTLELPGPAPRLRYLAQFPESQLFAATAGEDVGFGLRGSGEAAEQVARRALDAVGLPAGHFFGRDTAALSLGERRRVALAGALAGDPDVLLLDEPTAGLDPAGRVLLTRLLEDWWGASPAAARTLLVATHDPAWEARPGWRSVRLPAPACAPPDASTRSGSLP